MGDWFLIFIGAAFVNNFVLVRFLGLCPFMGVSTQYQSAMGMGFATAFVLTLSSIVSYLVNAYLLVPLELEYLKTLSFILVIAVTVRGVSRIWPGSLLFDRVSALNGASGSAKGLVPALASASARAAAAASAAA